MNIVMNERKYAESVLSGGNVDSGRNKLYTIGVVAKYYHAIGYNNREMKVAVGNLIKEKFPTASDKCTDSWVKKSLEIAKRYPLYEIDEIVITKPEIALINSLHSERFIDRNLKKFAFTLLCFAKFEGMKGVKECWVNTEWKQIFAAAGIKGMTVDKQCSMIYELYSSGYIDLNSKIKSHGIKVLGVRYGDTEIVVNNINECGYVFEEYNGKKFVKCEKCGAMVPKTNGRVKYCHNCAVEIDREKARERMRKTIKI